MRFPKVFLIFVSFSWFSQVFLFLLKFSYSSHLVFSFVFHMVSLKFSWYFLQVFFVFLTIYPILQSICRYWCDLRWMVQKFHSVTDELKCLWPSVLAKIKILISDGNVEFSILYSKKLFPLRFESLILKSYGINPGIGYEKDLKETWNWSQIVRSFFQTNLRFFPVPFHMFRSSKSISNLIKFYSRFFL